MRPKRLAIVAVSAVLCLAACAKRTRTVALSPPPPPPVVAPATVELPAPPPPVESPPPPADIPAAPVPSLNQADLAFSGGYYDEAARGYEEYLQRVPSGGERDHALFRMGLIQIVRSSPPPDWPRAASFLKQVVDEHPGSLLKPAAILILSLRAELDKMATDSQQREQRMRQLTSELDRLKKIDADRRKRP